MACNQCFHHAVCGSSSPYSDSSQCKTFIDKDSVVPIEVLHKAQIECERLDKYNRDLKLALNTAETHASNLEIEMRYLRVIEQTLEMCSGRKFNY